MSRDFQSIPVIRHMNSVMRFKSDLITELIHRACTDANNIEFSDSVDEGDVLGYRTVR